MPYYYYLVLIYPACLLWAAVSDLRTMTIPNRLSLILAVGFFPAALLYKPELGFIFDHLMVGLIGFCLGLAAFALRFMGGGDAKLIAATSLWFSFSGLLPLLVYIALMGGLLTILLILARFFFQVYVPSMPPFMQTLMKPKGDIPYGLGICAGAILAAPYSEILERPVGSLLHLFGL
jgi:prepilin peptidase CpaA